MTAEAEDAVDVPYSEEAEATVVGACVALPYAIDFVAEIVGPADFWHPSYRRLYEACAGGELPQTLDYETRIVATADLAGVAVQRVRALVHDRPCLADASGWARMVRETASRRRLMVTASEFHRGAATADPRRIVQELTDLLGEFQPLADQEMQRARRRDAMSAELGAIGKPAVAA